MAERARRSPHKHCPLGCEHPQPFKRDGKELCGRCYFIDGVITEMVDCTPEICGDDNAA